MADLPPEEAGAPLGVPFDPPHVVAPGGDHAEGESDATKKKAPAEGDALSATLSTWYSQCALSVGIVAALAVVVIVVQMMMHKAKYKQ